MNSDVKVEMLETVVIPTALYGTQSWMPNLRERSVEVFDMKYLRKVLGVEVIQRIRNEESGAKGPKLWSKECRRGN